MPSFGFSTGRSPVHSSPVAHVHDDVELSLLVSGGVIFLCHGRRFRVQSGDLLVLWAGHPHQVVAADAGSEVALVNLPLPDFLGMDLPWSLNQAVLAGGPVQDPSPDGVETELVSFDRWRALSDAGDAAGGRIARLEIEARLRRVARNLERGARRVRRPVPPPSAGRQHAERMMAFISSHYREPCPLPLIAAAAGLNRTYAAGLFRREVGMSVLEFLTRQRLAHARRCLLDGSRSVAAVARQCGFGSTGRFQAAFRTYLGTSPSAARRP